MSINLVDGEKLEKISIDSLYVELETSEEGLTTDEANKRISEFGLNALDDKHVSKFRKFLTYLWGPIPWMIEIAVILSLVVQNWADAVVIFLLLVVNTIIGFWQESKAESALDALKAGLAPKANVKRDGKFNKIDAVNLVPGDIIHVRLGDILPADCKLFEGEYLTVDQAALTGESLPVARKVGDVVYSGSVVKQGEMNAIVVATGSKTFFGKTAKLVSNAGSKSHFQQAILRIGNFLIISALVLAAILVAVEIFRFVTSTSGVSTHDIENLATFVLILVVASIPVAMPAVLSITMALGALQLSKHKAIVSKLDAIEEVAGIDILCSDKTGTLTKNQLTLNIPAVEEGFTEEDIVLIAALASNGTSNDAIDDTIIASIKDKTKYETYKQTRFIPFDPISKRTESELIAKNGSSFKATKGAPQVIMDLCGLPEEKMKASQDVIESFAKRGFRTLGIARNMGDKWEYLGAIPMYDPPRDDSASTIAEANARGVKVVMVTGDDTAIAKDTASQLNLSTNIIPAADIFKEGMDESKVSTAIEEAGGFSRVFPEHKYKIVKTLQDKGHIIGMTGDGVNDAPALKQADAGIAVSGATDAARAAAAIILTKPGLNVIIHAIEASRQIFARMLSYTVYRITMTFALMVFIVLSMILFPSVRGIAGSFAPLTAIMIILLALLNDIPIMTIAYDSTSISKTPTRWDMKRTLSVSTVLGALSVIQTLGFMIYMICNIGHKVWGITINVNDIQTMIFLQLIISGRLMLFLTRKSNAFFKKPFPAWQLLAALIGTQIFAELITGFGWNAISIAAVPWTLHGFIWVYNIIWMIALDIIKNLVYKGFNSKIKEQKIAAKA
ncbi:MAG: plasma-membrane proton-efflux P-type ATPase [Psittacicella sp.]